MFNKLIISFIAAIITSSSIITISYLSLKVLGDSETLISGILSAIGGVSGGAIGGIVAFYAAKSQIDDLRNARNEERNNKYINILNALISENNHNLNILQLISNGEDESSHLNLLESDIWLSIRFDANNLLPEDTFETLSEQHREFKDLKEKKVEVYNKEEFNYLITIQTIQTINKNLNGLKDDLKA
ncbi:hypothetical protein Q7A53_09080 [Halobacillus rhizosphaerae]|uniref:hypothetical protein n=1 Tax=Halobacillus rhizosphaerae TaxID=3064889 RepID=UPI00398AB8A4